MTIEKKRRRVLILAAAVLLAVLAAGLFFLAKSQKSGERRAYYFYFNPCASCKTSGEFAEFWDRQTADLLALDGVAAFPLSTVNSFQDESLQENQVKRLGIEGGDYSSQLLVMGDSYLTGSDIHAKLRQTLWREIGFASRDDVFEYYYRDDCPDCQEIKPLMDRFFQEHSQLTAVQIDTTDTQTKIALREMMNRKQIPEENRQIPFVTYGGRTYAGTEAIRKGLENGFSE